MPDARTDDHGNAGEPGTAGPVSVRVLISYAHGDAGHEGHVRISGYSCARTALMRAWIFPSRNNGSTGRNG